MQKELYKQKNHHLATISMVVDLGRRSSKVLKLVGGGSVKDRILGCLGGVVS